MRFMILAAASAALLTVAACEKAEDRAAGQATAKFDVQNCANDSVDAPVHMPASGCVLSPNKAYALVMQSSGSLDLVKVSATGQLGASLWTSGSKGKSEGSAAADFQEDGNLVVYEGTKPLWNSQTAGMSGRYNLSVTDQGNLVIKAPDGRPLWAAQFDLSLCPKTLDSPAQLAVHNCIASPTKTFVMVVEKTGSIQVQPVAADGSLGKAIWSSGNHLTGLGGGAPFMALQTDGNLVIYVSGKPVWNSQTSTKAPGAYHLELTDDGDLKLHRADGVVIWSSKTGKAKI